MELQEAIEYLKDYANWVRRLNREYPDTMGVVIDTVLAELDRQKEIKAEMRKVAFEEGFEQGRIKGIMEAAKEA